LIHFEKEHSIHNQHFTVVKHWSASFS